MEMNHVLVVEDDKEIREGSICRVRDMKFLRRQTGSRDWK